MEDYIYVFEIKNPIPHVLDNRIDEYDESKIIGNNFFFTYNKEVVYTKALLVFFQRECKVKINYTIWVKFDIKEFRSFIRNLDISAGELWGHLEDEVYLYKAFRNLEIRVRFSLKERVSIAKVIEIKHADSEIYHDFKNGLSMDKWDNIKINYDLKQRIKNTK